MKISVIGCGRWGTFIAWYLGSLGHELLLYGREQSGRYRRLLETGKNDLVTLGKNIALSSNLGQAVSHGEILIISISSQNLRDFMSQCEPLLKENQTIVLCMKGLEEKTGSRLTQIVAEYVPPLVKSAIWVGPGHVQDFTAGIPNCMVIDSADPGTIVRLVEAFSGSLIRFYYGDDLIGNEIGSASKNVVGIAAGILDGLNKTALKGALMSRGTREIARLIKAAGGNENTAYGLGHLGDYQATVFSPYSHNRLFGELFVRRQAYDQLAEGVSTAKALMVLSKRYHVELPICEAVCQVLFENKDPNRILSDLFLRDLKIEFK